MLLAIDRKSYGHRFLGFTTIGSGSRRLLGSTMPNLWGDFYEGKTDALINRSPKNVFIVFIGA